MKRRIPSLNEYINESTQTEKFVIINKHGNYLKSFEYGGISSDWCTDVEEAKVFSTNDTAYNVMGYHLSREIAKESRIQKLDEHVNEGNNQKSFSDDYTIKDNDYKYKEDSGGGRGTWVLLLGHDAWKKVKHLFDDSGRPADNSIKRIPAYGSVWDLYAQSYVSNGKEMHKIYGVSGDYTFGNAPTYYQQRLRGNKKAAKKVFDWFITMYLQN